MTSKLIPSDPSKVMVIRQVTPNITTCSAPFLRFGRLKVGGRGTIGLILRALSVTVLRCTSSTPQVWCARSLLSDSSYTRFVFPRPIVPLFKPIENPKTLFQDSRAPPDSIVLTWRNTTEVRSTVESMGNKVGYIAALDYEHHIFITEWANAFPSAKLLGVEGLQEKREKAQATAGTKFQHVWTQKNKASMTVDPDFDSEFDYEYVGSHANKELVLLHKPDRTLIEAEYVFSLSVSPRSNWILSLETSRNMFPELMFPYRLQSMNRHY